MRMNEGVTVRAGRRGTRLRTVALSLALPAMAAACGSDSIDSLIPIARQLQYAGGGDQQGVTNAVLGDSLRVRVTDTRGRVLAGVPVAWLAGARSGAPTADTTFSDAAGLASVAWRLGDAEVQRLTAHVAGTTDIEFEARAHGFALGCWPREMTHQAGDLRVVGCDVAAVGGFAADIAISSTLPAGLELALSDVSVPLSAAQPENGVSGTLRISRDLLPGQYRLRFEAAGGGAAATDSITLTIR